MSFSPSWLIILLIGATSVGILIVNNWRWLIIVFSIQYAAVFILTLQHWPIGMATVKVIAGWMSATILGMTRSNFDDGEESRDILPQGRFFRLVAAGVVGLIALSGTSRVDSMMANTGATVAAGSILLIGMGSLHLAVVDEPMRVTIGLMTVLSGFEILYSTVESSILVVALLAVINLGLALAGSYLMIATNSQEAEPT